MQVTNDDLRLILRNNIYPLKIKLEILDMDNKIIDTLHGIISSGNATINADSDIRRSLSVTILPSSKYSTLSISEDGLIWVNRSVKFYIGIDDVRTGECTYYLQGTYYFTDASYNYDASTNSLSINCGDYVTALDGSKNGIIGGALNTIFYAYDELFLGSWIEEAKADGVDTSKYLKVFEWAKENHPNMITETEDDAVMQAVYNLITKSLTEEQQNEYINTIRPSYIKPITFIKLDDIRMLISYNVIRDAVVEIVKTFAKIENFFIDDIGEIKGIADYNSDWKSYREKHENWNVIPYDQEFSCGDTIVALLTAFRDLYPNYEFFFTEDNLFVFQMIPSCYKDEITYSNDFIQKCLISENSSVPLNTVRNICEVWGKSIEVDFYTEKCSYKDNVYTATVDGYDEEYYNGDIIGVKIPSDNEEAAKLQINGITTIDICDEYNDSLISAGKIKAGVQTFKIDKNYEDGKTTVRAYYLGQWQPHALDVLTDGTESNETFIDQDGIESKVYSEQYFKSVYNVNVVNMNIQPDSPFTVQKIGEILDVKCGNEYDNILSDSEALERAKLENTRTSRIADSLSITTKLIPFLDVNKKVSYKKVNSDVEHQYIIKSVSHSFDNWTSSITLERFYPLYENID